MTPNKSISACLLDTQKTTSLQSNTSLAQETSEQIARLLSSLYCDVSTPRPIHIGKLVTRLFLIPAVLAASAPENQIKHIKICAEYLLDNLSWLAGLSSVSHEIPANTITINFYIDSYTIKYPEEVYINYINTLIAHTALDMFVAIANSSIEGRVLIPCLEKLKDACDLYLKHPSVIFQKIDDYTSCYLLFSFLQDKQQVAPAIANNPYFEIIKNNFEKLSAYHIGFYAKKISRLLFALKHPGDILTLINNLAMTPEKPLIYIARVSLLIPLELVDKLIKQQHPDKIKFAFLLLLISALEPVAGQQSYRIREDLLILLYTKYAKQTKENSAGRELIFKVLTMIYLTDEKLCSPDDPAWSSELIVLSDNFNFAFAFCLSRASGYSVDEREKLFDMVAKVTDPSLGIVSNWFKVLQQFDLDFNIRKEFFKFCPRHSFHKKEAISSVLIYFNTLLEKYNKTPPSLPKDATNLELLSRWFLLLIATTKIERPFLIKAILETPENLTRPLFIFFLGAEPLSEVLQLKDHGTLAHYETDYLKAITIPSSMKESILALSSDNTYFKINLLLIFLAVISRPTTNSILPGQNKWGNWIISLIGQVNKDKDSPLQQIISECAESLYIQNLLSREHKKSFISAMQPTSCVDTATSFGDAFLKQLDEEAASATKKPPKSLITTRTQQQTSVIASKPKLSSPPKTPDIKPTQPPKIKRPVSVSPPKAPSPSLFLPEISFEYFKLPYLRDLTKILNDMEPIRLPPRLEKSASIVRTQLNCLVDNLGLAIQPQAAATSSKIEYSELAHEEQLSIETKWNEFLAKFCANLQTELINYKPLNSQQETLKKLIESSLFELNFCYFKNLELHLDTEVMRFITILDQFFDTQGYQITIKGSFFCDPRRANDLDLLVTPKHDNLTSEKKAAPLITEEIELICAKFNIIITQERLYQKDAEVMQKIHVLLPNKCTIDVDWIASNTHCPPKLELHKTAGSPFSCGAVHWHLDGHAVMQPTVARANCSSHPALVYLPDNELAESPEHIALLLKYLIKFPGIRPDPQVKKVLDDSINPETRIAIVETENCIKHKFGALTGLEYQLNHIQVRTLETIHFIFDKRLLLLLFTVSPQIHEFCKKYFTTHFMLIDNPENLSRLSSSSFLATFFLGIFLDYPESVRESVFDTLRKAEIMCASMPSLSKIIHKAILILEVFPVSTSELVAACMSSEKSPCEQPQRFVKRSLEDIFKLWQANQQVKQGAYQESIVLQSPSIKP